ncbi:MAG: hypothetical protein PF569_03390 [Candidatus Woesearchaeota archaeon]|nr:hypothetical protein [Candidatus Woesearchaeota archaeon]
MSSIVYSIKVEISITEDSAVTKLLNDKYSLDASGILTIKNPSNVSKVYEFVLPLDLDSLIGINKINLPNSSTFNNITNITTSISPNSEKFEFSFDKIKGYMIEPNQSISVGYHIFGLSEYNIYNNLNDTQSVLDYYVKSYDLVSNVILNLQKPQREDFEYNIDGTLNKTPSSNSSRLVSAQIRNPTDYDYFIDELKLYKTSVSDPFFNNGGVLNSYFNLSINPFGYREVDFYDINSDETSVYWVSSSVFILTDINSTLSKVYKLENKGGGSSDNDANTGGGGGVYISDTIKDSIIFKKDVDKTIISKGDEFNVILTLANVKDRTILDLELSDEVPEGYEIKNVSTSVKISNRDLTFDISKIEGYETKNIIYTLVSKKEYKGITYLKPAKLSHNDETLYSEGVLLINDMLPDQKIFIQKEVKYMDDDYAKVIITVKNLGNFHLEDLLISDEIPDDSIIKQISKVFLERGVWSIKSLKPGEEWEVSYLISRDGSNFDTLPNIFGVEKSDVYGTMIFSEEIVTIFNEEPRTIEKVGMTLAVGFLIVYLLF